MILYAFVFLMFVGLGYMFWRGYRARKVFFQNVLGFCDHLLVEISFSKSTIRTVIDKYGATYGKHFRAVLVGYQALLDDKQDITRERIDALLWAKLKHNERATVADFFYDLGRHGAAEEKLKIENKRAIFDGFFGDAVKALKKDGSIYLKLFILLGVGAVVLLM